MSATMEAGFSNAIITLDERSALYYTGQEISGSVHFKLNNTLLFKAINLKIVGEANVRWSESQTVKYHGVKNYGDVMYQSHEEYFNYVQCLCGGQGVSQLQPRTYTLSFKFQVPHNVPSSFKGEKGEVKYTMRFYVQFPDPHMPEERIIKEFKVVSPYNLNNGGRDVKQPAEILFDEILATCCLCTSNPLNISIKLPASGFCPRDVIPVAVSVKNNSSVDVKSILMQIVSRERYRSQKPRAEYVPPDNVIVEGLTSGVKGNTKRTFTCDLTVPKMVVPNLDNCSIMDLEHYFRVTVRLSGCNDYLDESSRIYLGMIPLHKTDIGWNTVTDDKLPNGRLPDPDSPITPGIISTPPSFPISLVPAMSMAQNPGHRNIGFVVNPEYQSSYPYPGNSPGLPSPYSPSAPPML